MVLFLIWCKSNTARCGYLLAAIKDSFDWELGGLGKID